MADSLFQQAVHKVKEVFSSSEEPAKASFASNEQKNEHTSKGTNFEMGMMQSLLTAGMGSMSKEDQQKVQELQQSFQINEQNLGSPKNHNGKMDISESVVSSVINEASPEEQQQLHQFQKTLGIEPAQGNYTEHADQHTQQQMGIAQETLAHAANQANAKEKAQLNELADVLDGKMS